MKKIMLFFFIVLLVGCDQNTLPSTTEGVLNETNDHSIENNVVNEEVLEEVEDLEEPLEIVDDEEEKVFDKETLAMYNGENGMPAYVAVDGVVYDVSNVPAWQGKHQGRYAPGKDYSKEITQSPHGKKNLEGLPVVGKYEE